MDSFITVKRYANRLFYVVRNPRTTFNYAKRKFRRTLSLRYIIFRCRRLFGQKQILWKLANHDVSIYIDTRDAGLSADLYVHGSREPLASEQILKYLHPGQTIIDIGANLGYYALIEASRVQPQGKVYAIEPSRENIELLKKSVEANKYNNIIGVTHGAIGEKSGTAKLYLSKKFNWHTVAPAVNPESAFYSYIGTSEVPIWSLDDFAEYKQIDLSSISLVRMDIEGYEVEVLSGMKRMLELGYPKVIFMEVHQKQIVRRLGEAGYKDFIQKIYSLNYEIIAMKQHSVFPPKKIDRRVYNNLENLPSVFMLFLVNKEMQS